MYLQITTRCNMRCAHCCFSADHTGSDMSVDTLKAALKLAGHYDEYITIGGGEPTVHPQFFEFLGLATAYNPEPSNRVLVVTNGKRKEIALRLAAMAREGLVWAELSQDDFHDPISGEVIQAFTRKPRRWDHAAEDRDLRGIRTVERILPVGRAAEEGVATEESGCTCDSLLVDPQGRLWACGCKTIQLGTVWEPDFPADGWSSEWAHTDEAQTWAESRALQVEYA